MFSGKRVTMLMILGIFFLIFFTQNALGAGPFGSLDNPVDGSAVSGTVQITGWTLDDVEVANVKIYRIEGASLVYIGDGAFVEGARPDVAADFPYYPNSQKAGWSYSLVTNSLPDGGNSSYPIQVIATDNEGNQITLGTSTIHCDNANAVKPFGNIDTPAQGGAVSGASYTNSGWVLTPPTDTIPIHTIPTDGSTIHVYIDGVNVGHPIYNIYRSDIATLFPGYANSNGAGASFTFDTTAYTDGVHTIQWTATDDAGNSDGIGSRYFNIQNGPVVTPPTVTTTAITGITATTASVDGTVTSNGGKSVTERGVCWSTSVHPLASYSHTTDGTGTGTFTSTLTGLIPGTTYYVRAYATNTAGTAYGNEVSFTTQEVVIPPPSDSDGDGLPDWEEQGPDGNDPGYDGNGDGIPDWQQDNVTSFHTYDQQGGKHYITLAIPSGQWIEYVHTQRAFDTPPPEGVSFPYGLFSFTLAGLQAGGATTMTIYLGGTPPQTYYKYGKTPDGWWDHWYKFSYDGQTGAEVVGNTVVLHFIDGQRGDHDLEENGRIADPGGPAEIAPHEGLYFPYLVSTNDEKTEIGIINTENYTCTSTISYYGENGDLIKTATITLWPNGKATVLSDSIPPNSESAIVSGDGNLLGYTRYVNAQGKRCAWPAGTSLQKSLSVPHTAVDANWATSICLFNPSDDAVEATLAYESGASGSLTLNPKSRKFLWLGETESVVSISSTGYISGMELFDSLIPGGDAAALLLRERSLNALYVPSILYGSGEFTGIGLKHYYNGTINVTGHSAAGETEEISFGTQPLGTQRSQRSQSRMAFNISGMLGDENLWAGISGEADFTTPFGTPLLHFRGLAVYGKDDTGKLGAVNLNALRFKEGFIGILSADPNPAVALLNPNTAEATVTVTGYNASGEALAGDTMKIAAGSNWTGTFSDLLDDISPNQVTHVKMVSDVDLYGFETVYTDDRMEVLPVQGME